MDRWISQFEQPDDSPSRAAASISRSEHDGLTIHLLDLAGTYVAETSPGSGERVLEPGYRTLSAVVETPYGPYYAKLVGEADTVERWASSYHRFLATLRP